MCVSRKLHQNPKKSYVQNQSPKSQPLDRYSTGHVSDPSEKTTLLHLFNAIAGAEQRRARGQRADDVAKPKSWHLP